MKLQAVSCYVYLGFLIQCNLRSVQLLKILRKIGNQRTWTLIQLAAKHNLRIPQSLIMWKSVVFNAIKHLLIFCPVDVQTLNKLSVVQESWAKAILGWGPKLPGQAAICDLGWQHITRELMLARCSLYARIKSLPDAPVYVRMKDMLSAAACINTGWSYHTSVMFQAAISPVQPPAGDITWRSMLPLATRNLKRLDDVLWQATLSCSSVFQFYPKHGLSPNHQHILYRLRLDFNKCKLFGSMRAGAQTFPHPSKGCPACGHTAYNIAHMLRSCKSTRHLLNVWLRQVDPSVGAGRMTLNEQEFARSIFDLSSIPNTKDRQATVNFVWDSTQTAIRSATRRRNGN